MIEQTISIDAKTNKFMCVKLLALFVIFMFFISGLAYARIESTKNISDNTKEFSCVCDKTGKEFERIKKKDIDGYEPRLSNTEAAFCDEEIPKFIEWLKKEGYGGDCWCKHIKEYVENTP